MAPEAPPVIPSKDGIQSSPGLLDPGFRRGDGVNRIDTVILERTPKMRVLIVGQAFQTASSYCLNNDGRLPDKDQDD